MESQTYTSNYEVFGANMTVDIQAGIYSVGHISSCQSCQCHCHLCRGHRTPTETGVLSKAETESALEKLLISEN